MQDPRDFDFAIIGGGAAGVLLALRLLRDARAGRRIALIEPGVPGQGVAYGTDDPAHILNVPAGNMGAESDAPSGFVDFLRARDGVADPAAFMPRRDYAAYLQARLARAVAESGARFVHVAQRATGLQHGDAGAVVTLEDGERITSRRVALATGNHPREFAPEADHARIVPAWDRAALARIAPEDDIAILGSGLSMVDVLLMLDARDHRGKVTVVSRHGLLPKPHPMQKQALDVDVAALEAMPLRARLHRLRQLARDAADEGIGWQALMDALRHHVRGLWQALAPGEQDRFLRHAVRHWDVHRHRIAPAVARQMQADIERGQLAVLAARVLDIETRGETIAMRLRPRHRDDARTITADWLVNATGIETRARAFDDPLLRGLLRDGLARPGPHGLGFDTRDDGALLARDGQAQPWLAAIGSLRLGNLWESTAIPDLRVDAAALAAHWLADA